MTPSCAHCGAAPNYLQAGFDRYQCMSCGGFTAMDGRPTVPTSALEPGATYEGPGFELILDPAHPEVTQGTDASVQLAQSTPPRDVVTSSPETGNPTPGGETPEGTAPQPVQVADNDTFPTPPLTGEQPSQAPGTVPAPPPTEPTPAPPPEAVPTQPEPVTPAPEEVTPSGEQAQPAQEVGNQDQAV